DQPCTSPAQTTHSHHTFHTTNSHWPHNGLHNQHTHDPHGSERHPTLQVPSPSELPKYRKYNGSGNRYTRIKDFIYESASYQHDRCLMAYLFRQSLDGHALDWFYSLLPADAEHFAVVKAKFLEQFQDRVGPEYSLTDLMADKMKSDEDFASYVDRWRQMATIVPGYLPEGEMVKIMIANAMPAYRNILAMNDISTMHQLYSRARFIQTQLKDSPIHSMFEPQKSQFQRKPQGPVTEGVQVNEQVSAFNPAGQSQNRQPYNAQGQNPTQPPQGQPPRQYNQVPPPDGSQQRRPMGPRRTHYPPLSETLSDIFLALLSTDAIRLPPERPLNPSSKREVNLARVNAVKRKEPLSTKGWQIMMKLGYEEGKGLGAELQGIVKPIPDVVMKSRWGLGYREKSKPWSSSASTLKADREPLTWTLWCHFIKGPTQPGYNTVVVEAELSQHEVHGRNFSRHMAPLLTYRALEALRPTRRRKTGDSEAEWYRWFDIEDITIAFSRLFWEEERTWPPAAEEFLVPSSPPLLIQLTPQLLTAAHSLLTPELPPAVLSALQADPGDHEVEKPAYVLHSSDQGHSSAGASPPAPSLGAILFEDSMSSPSLVESSSLGESRVGESSVKIDRPRIESQVSPLPSKSKHHPRKQRGKAIPRRYLQELARRCQALLLIEEFTREALVFEEVFKQDGVFIDDGFGVYEIMNDEDPVDEEDSEVLSTYRSRDLKLKPYQDLVTLLARQFRKLIYIHTPRSQNILADALASLFSSLSFPLSHRTETIVVQRLDVPSTQDPWFSDLRAILEEKARKRGAQQVMITELEEILNEEELPWYFEIEQYCRDGTYPEGASAEDRVRPQHLDRGVAPYWESKIPL
ncbi:hypothetical protein Taro_031173, partial [Colocasia esculenta]|nr:hypothetical protein [Colocasia esculenta]